MYNVGAVVSLPASIALRDLADVAIGLLAGGDSANLEAPARCSFSPLAGSFPAPHLAIRVRPRGSITLLSADSHHPVLRGHGGGTVVLLLPRPLIGPQGACQRSKQPTTNRLTDSNYTKTKMGCPVKSKVFFLTEKANVVSSIFVTQ